MRKNEDSDSGEDEERLEEFDRAAREHGDDPLAVLSAFLEARAAPTESGQEHPGIRVGDWVLQRLLGRGGMGSTWLARSADGTEVALKLLDRPTPDRVARFEAEARALARLAHPNVVRYLDHGNEEGTGRAWLAMEYVAGPTLEQVLIALEEESPGADEPPLVAAFRGADGRQVHAPRFLRFFLGLARALAHLHEQGLVHRDLKPGNVIVHEDGGPVLIDLGLSRDLWRPVTYTRSLLQLGTPGYMAPEQFGNTEVRVGPWTDVYAFGAMLHRVFLGRERHADAEGLSLASYRQALLLSRSELRRLPEGLAPILYRALEFKPSRRHPDAAALVTDLEALLDGRHPKTGNLPLHRRFMRSRRAMLGTGIALGVGAVGAIGALSWFGFLRPRYWLNVQTLNAGGTVSLNGVPHGTAPFLNAEVRPGPLDVSYDPKPFQFLRLHRRIVITPERHHYGLVLRTLSQSDVSRLEVTHTRYAGDDACLLHVNAPLDAEVFIGDERFPPVATRAERHWVQVAPGRVHLRARHRDWGVEESQEVELRPKETHEVQLLGRHAEDDTLPSDRWIRTIGSVVMPLPDDVSFRADDGIVPFLASYQDPGQTDSGYVSRNTSYTGMVQGRRQGVTMSARLPVPMRRVRCIVNCDEQLNLRPTIRARYRFDDGPWIDVANKPNKAIEIDASAEDATRFEVHASLVPEQLPITYAQRSVFLGRIDPVKHSGFAAQVIGTPSRA